MAIGEAGQGEPALQIDHTRAGAPKRPKLVVLPYPDDAISEDGERAGGATGERKEAAVGEDEVGVHGHQARVAAGRLRGARFFFRFARGVAFFFDLPSTCLSTCPV